MKRCSILYIAPHPEPHVSGLRELGFDVIFSRNWPDEDALFTGVEAVILALRDANTAASAAMRLRAKRNFNRRVLMVTLEGGLQEDSSRDAQMGGIDWVFPAPVETRILAARLLRILRTRTEHPCQLRRRRAA